MSILITCKHSIQDDWPVEGAAHDLGFVICNHWRVWRSEKSKVHDKGRITQVHEVHSDQVFEIGEILDGDIVGSISIISSPPSSTRTTAICKEETTTRTAWHTTAASERSHCKQGNCHAPSGHREMCTIQSVKVNGLDRVWERER